LLSSEPFAGNTFKARLEDFLQVRWARSLAVAAPKAVRARETHRVETVGQMKRARPGASPFGAFPRHETKPAGPPRHADM
jgi:hypothetical protein